MTGREPTRSRKELFLRACRCEPVERVPVWIMRQAGRYLPEYRAARQKYSFLQVCKTPELAAEVSLQPLRILGVDAVIVFSDILIPAEAMGLPLEIGDSGPRIATPVRDRRQVESLAVFDPQVETRFVGDAIRMLGQAVGAEVPIIGFAGAPWTLACYLLEGRSNDGFPEAKRFLYEQPSLLRTLMEKIALATAGYLRAQVAAGACAVQLFDTWAGELSQADYVDFALPATQRVIAELEAANVPVILYTKGSSHLLSSLPQTGADVLSVDWRQDLAQIRQSVGERVALQGNVDPCVLLGTPEVIERKVKETIAQTRGLGHILNLGHGILPTTPIEGAKTFVRAGQGCSFKEAATSSG